MKVSNSLTKNSIFLYSRLIVSILVNLYSTRVLLLTLGAKDYGIFNLVAGVVAMLSFLNGAMTVTTQRYLSFNIGKEDKKKTISILNTSISLHLLIAIVVTIVLEIIGSYLFDRFLNISKDRIEAAKIVYQFSVVATFFTINAVPYDALINSYERFKFDAIVGIGEVVLKLIIVLFLNYSNIDSLILYSGSIAGLTIIIRIIKSQYCRKNFTVIKSINIFNVDKSVFYEMFSYSSWNLFGALCYVGSTQGLAIILNLFNGVIVNASYAVANQIGSQLLSFSVMASRALNPQIVKSEGKGNRGRMVKLSTFSSKISVIILSFITIPIIVEINYILNIWLDEVPKYATEFCIIILINALINQVSIGLKTAVQAVGKIKLYQSVVGTTVLLVVPTAYLIMKAGGEPIHVLIGSTVIELISLLVRICIANKIYSLNIVNFFKKIVLKLIVSLILTLVVVFFLTRSFEESLIRLIMTSILSSIVYCTLCLTFILDGEEKNKILEVVKTFTAKFKKPIFS